MPDTKSIQEKFYAALDAAGNDMRSIAVAQGEYAASVSAANMEYLMKYLDQRLDTLDQRVARLEARVDMLEQRGGDG